MSKLLPAAAGTCPHCGHRLQPELLHAHLPVEPPAYRGPTDADLMALLRDFQRKHPVQIVHLGQRPF